MTGYGPLVLMLVRAAHRWNPLQLRARLRVGRRVVDYWTGGAHIDRIVEGARGKALLRLSLQPDGDVVLRVPHGFGQTAQDRAAFQALLTDADQVVGGLGQLSLGLDQLFDYVTGAAWACAIGINRTNLYHLAWGVALPLVLRTCIGPLLRRGLLFAVEHWIRRRLNLPAVSLKALFAPARGAPVAHA